jgi:TldD protein
MVTDRLLWDGTTPDLDLRLLRRVMARLGSRVTLADVCLQRTSTLDVSLADRGPRVFVAADGGIGLRAVRDAVVLYAAANGYGMESALDMATWLRGELDGDGASRRADELGPWGGQPSARLPEDALPEDALVADTVGAVRAAHDVALTVGGAGTVVQVTYNERVERVMVVTSDDTISHERRRRMRIGVHVSRPSADGLVESYEAEGITGDEPGLESAMCRVARRAAQRAVAMSCAETSPSGELPVVLAPGLGGLLVHEACGHGLEADAVARGSSRVSSARWRPACGQLTVVDDPGIPGLFGSYGSDWEGTPAECAALVVDGAVTGVLADRVWGMALGIGSNGHGVRQDYRFPPLPRMTNTRVQPGTEDPKSLIRAVADGLYIASLSSGGVNTSSGDCQFDISEAYRIQSGEITTPVGRAFMTASAEHVIKGIEAIASDLATLPNRCGKAGQWVPCSHGSPTLLVRGLTMARYAA